MRTVELITRPERRRHFTPDEKVALLAEAMESTVAITARRHGISPSVIYLWKKQQKESSSLVPSKLEIAHPQPPDRSPFVRVQAAASENIPGGSILIHVNEAFVVELPMGIDLRRMVEIVSALKGA